MFGQLPDLGLSVAAVRGTRHVYRAAGSGPAGFDEERLSRPASGIVLGLVPLPFQALGLMFIVGCQFDERFPYENVEGLARQSLAFPRLSMKGFFGSHRTAPLSDEDLLAKRRRSLRLVPSVPMPML